MAQLGSGLLIMLTAETGQRLAPRAAARHMTERSGSEKAGGTQAHRETGHSGRHLRLV